MTPPNPINEEIVRMYQNDAPIDDITSHFHLSHWTIYSRLRASGITPNRKSANAWTDIEDYQLITAYIGNITGQAYCEEVPTRSYEGIQSRLKKLRRVKGGVVR